VSPGATIVLGAGDTVERRSGRKITAKGYYRDAVRSTKKHVIRCFGLKWVSMMQQVRRWWPGRRLVLVVDGGFAAVSLACVKHRVIMVSRRRWNAALYHQSGPQAPSNRGPKPTKGKRQRSMQGWVSCSDTPSETVEVNWYGGQCKQLWIFSRTAVGRSTLYKAPIILSG
jgi:hypothetical protein